jgi:hypothetical protein
LTVSIEAAENGQPLLQIVRIQRASGDLEGPDEWRGLNDASAEEEAQWHHTA